jgi:hypothetical protein
MTPALFVDFGFEALRRSRLGIIVARTALWTRHSCAAAGAGALALERSIRVGFTDPPAILTNGALHGACYRAGLFFHSTNRITLRRFVRSSACMTLFL